MREEASQWLARIGIDRWREPWPDYDSQAARISASIEARETWMARDDAGQIAGTVALDAYADPRLWTPDEQNQPAMYLHRLIAAVARLAALLDGACGLVMLAASYP